MLYDFWLQRSNSIAPRYTGRKLIKEGEVTVKDPKGKTTDSLIFLLTDNLLLTKPIKKNEYKLYDNIKLVASLSADGTLSLPLVLA